MKLHSGKLFGVSTAVVVGFGLMAPVAADASVLLTVEAAKVQTSQVAGVITETFDGFSGGNKTSMTTAVGTITSPGVSVQDANQYGGAGGSGKYIAIGAQSSTLTALLTFNSPQSYVGLWLSALDGNNGFELLSGGQVVAEYEPSALRALLTSEYYGNPNNGQNTSEPYAYLNFIGLDGQTFDALHLHNSSTGTGLELDNISIYSSTPNPIPGTPVPGGLVSVPEPSALAIGVAGMGLLAGRRRR